MLVTPSGILSEPPVKPIRHLFLPGRTLSLRFLNPLFFSNLQVQRPACPWEFYIYRQLDVRIPAAERRGFGTAKRAFCYAGTSVLVAPYGEHGTLQDLVNAYLAAGQRGVDSTTEVRTGKSGFRFDSKSLAVIRVCIAWLRVRLWKKKSLTSQRQLFQISACVFLPQTVGCFSRLAVTVIQRPFLRQSFATQIPHVDIAASCALNPKFRTCKKFRLDLYFSGLPTSW